jgi:hypothetical protein
MPTKFVVSPAPIRREIKKVARKLIRLRKKPASRRKRKAIDLEIKILRTFFNKIGNVRFP